MFTWLESFYSDLHWKRTGFFPKLLLLVLATLKFVPDIILFGIVAALVSYASTTYSITGTMHARVSDAEDNGVFPLAVMFSGSLQLVCAILSLVSALLATLFRPFLSANQCDVVSRILQKSHLRIFSALIAEEGLRRNPKEHTRAFLHIRVIETRCVSKKKALGELGKIGSQTLSFSDRRQAARVHRQLSDAYAHYGEYAAAETERGYALWISRESGLRDQALKASIT